MKIRLIIEPLHYTALDTDIRKIAGLSTASGLSNMNNQNPRRGRSANKLLDYNKKLYHYLKVFILKLK